MTACNLSCFFFCPSQKERRAESESDFQIYKLLWVSIFFPFIYIVSISNILVCPLFLHLCLHAHCGTHQPTWKLSLPDLYGICNLYIQYSGTHHPVLFLLVSVCIACRTVRFLWDGQALFA